VEPEEQTGAWRRLCRWCHRDLIRLAYGGPDDRDVVILCERCDAPTVAVMWGDG
jgi:hypothetical protein